jgi:hypothetical protein
MLVYEHERTEQIVQRLQGAARLLAYITIPVAIAAIGLAGGWMGAAIAEDTKVGMRAGLAVGGLVGLFVGIYVVPVLSAIIEWMCQMLIAQGALLDTTRKPTKD